MTSQRTQPHEFDTSDYPEDNQFGMPRVNKKKVGLMKDECNGKILLEFIGLRSKMYSMNIEGRPSIKEIERIKTSVVKASIKFTNYASRCLTQNESMPVEKRNIDSRLHVIHTEEETKIAVSPHDDKRKLVENSTDTLPWGHYSLRTGVARAVELTGRYKRVIARPELIPSIDEPKSKKGLVSREARERSTIPRRSYENVQGMYRHPDSEYSQQVEIISHEMLRDLCIRLT